MVMAIALALGSAAVSSAHAGLLGNVIETVTTATTETLSLVSEPTTTATTNAAIAENATRLRNTMMSEFPTFVGQAKASPMAVYQLYHLSMHNPLYFLPQFKMPAETSGPQRFMDRFPTADSFVAWVDKLHTSPDAAIAEFQENPQYGAELLTSMDNITRMLSDRLPANMANSLPVVGQLMAGMMGGGQFGGGPLSVGPDSGVSHQTLSGGGLDQMWCHVTDEGGMLGRILRGALGDPALASDGGAGDDPSLLPYYGLGSSPTGSGFSLSADYIPLLNSNTVTGDLNEIITRSLPVLPSILPNSVLGLVTFHTYHVTDRTGAGSDQTEVPANDSDWTAAAIEIGVPGVMRLWTVEFICPGMNRHSVNATPPAGANPTYDPMAESNYTGYTNVDITHRKSTFSWGFGDGLVDDVWIYGHYAPFATFGAGDTGPGVAPPSEHQHP
jgi:hypothetical protein